MLYQKQGNEDDGIQKWPVWFDDYVIAGTRHYKKWKKSKRPRGNAPGCESWFPHCTAAYSLCSNSHPSTTKDEITTIAFFPDWLNGAGK